MKQNSKKPSKPARKKAPTLSIARYKALLARKNRELEIEAALEQVRAKAMAMHNSADLAATINAFYQTLLSLNQTPKRCGVGILDRETRMAELSTTNTTAEGVTVDLVGTLSMTNHPVLEGVYDHWIRQEEYHPVLRGNEIREYYKILRPQINFPEYPNDVVQYGYFFFFEDGGIYAWTDRPMQDDELKIFRRFSTVMNLTYKRYKDLKEAEARTKEAVMQAAVDRVRAEIASMRTTKDLELITPLIWRELTTLGVPFVRCGVFIMDEQNRQIGTFLSTPDGKAIAAFSLPYDSMGNLSEAVNAWREHRTFVTHWVDKDFKLQADVLLREGAITSRDQYLSTLPKEGIYLHFLPFLRGMLYVGSLQSLNADDMRLTQAVADAFSTAYARYEDFKNLESAKQEIEKTLTDLKQTQVQLVQSEKMASLGELTAGIAHEIQNPLNFVNNFAEVSKELLDEMKSELSAGNVKPATDLAESIIHNLEKINHHGKRADAIVKSMLQHSRKSTGKKEPTDINALCEEYLRLAYHGIRAKDKNFNTRFETVLDPSIGMIMALPQDISRVILNLINNAFYAVSEKMKQGDSQYEPLVTIRTSKVDGNIEISLKDNGIGIPSAIKEKIFRPFFTTKPTGQGTGLGLSLSYEIVKAHGGELNFETKEGEGTTFFVKLFV